jgi:nitrous oxide reductase accessory protein NosL
MRRLLLRGVAASLISFATVSFCLAGPLAPSKPAPRDKCPVCGMFVAKYPDFIAQVIFRDGTVFYFDGVKDLMKFYFRLDRYSPGRKQDDIAAVWVTDYYRMSPVDGRKAHYVIGSNVYGPMGKELIPFEKKAEAEEFLRDHRGERVLAFGEITPDLLKGLD